MVSSTYDEMMNKIIKYLSSRPKNRKKPVTAEEILTHLHATESPERSRFVSTMYLLKFRRVVTWDEPELLKNSEIRLIKKGF